MTPLIRRNRLQRFWLRCKIAFKVLFFKKHIVVVYITTEELTELIKNGDVKEVTWSFAGISLPYAQKLIKIVGNGFSETEIICNKAEFEAAVEEEINKGKL